MGGVRGGPLFGHGTNKRGGPLLGGFKEAGQRPPPKWVATSKGPKWTRVAFFIGHRSVGILNAPSRFGDWPVPFGFSSSSQDVAPVYVTSVTLLSYSHPSFDLDSAACSPVLISILTLMLPLTVTSPLCASRIHMLVHVMPCHATCLSGCLRKWHSSPPPHRPAVRAASAVCYPPE